MSNSFELNNIYFSYDTSAELLFKNISISFPVGWTGIVGENGSGKSTLLQLASGILNPCSGKTSRKLSTVYCAQRTDNPPENFSSFFSATEGSAYKLKGILDIQEEWFYRWETISHGERKRIQIAATLWKMPQLLAVDEPTNHLDKEARDLIIEALQNYDGIGLIVSHDRELLDNLCSKCIFIEPPEIKLYIGNYSQCATQKRIEEESAITELQNARREYEKVKSEVQKRREAAERAEKNRSKKHIDKKDHDAKEKIDRYIVSGRDGRAGQLKRQLKGRLQQSQEKMLSIKTKKEYDTGIWLNSEVSWKNCLFRVPEGQLRIGDIQLSYPDLEMYSTDKIAITGVNGTGKSTLINYIIKSINISQEKLIYIPQEISISLSKDIFRQISTMQNDKKGRIMAIIRHLGSDPERLLNTLLPSPGEIRKLILAFGIQKEPSLIIMDEPTNHLDICSIKCMEIALKECPCGLLLVSHDCLFLNKLTIQRWHITKNNKTNILNKTFW